MRHHTTRWCLNFILLINVFRNLTLTVNKRLSIGVFGGNWRRPSRRFFTRIDIFKSIKTYKSKRNPLIRFAFLFLRLPGIIAHRIIQTVHDNSRIDYLNEKRHLPFRSSMDTYTISSHLPIYILFIFLLVSLIINKFLK